MDDAGLAERIGITASMVTKIRRERMEEGVHFTRGAPSHGGGIEWLNAGLVFLGELFPDLNPSLAEFFQKNAAPAHAPSSPCSLKDPTPSPYSAPPAPDSESQKKQAPPTRMIAVRRINDHFLLARREQGDNSPVKVRHRSPELFPPNFIFDAVPWSGEEPWWVPVKTPRWKGKW